MTAAERGTRDARGASGSAGDGNGATRDARRVRIVPGGPILVEGPVDMTTPDGHRVCSDRFMVAVCACRRSKNYPLCDTSHRRKVRPTDTDDAQG
ncbi:MULTISPECIES: CDGSH iron-sulfur domain-containing protein [Dietzia]|uniref:CDGSH iron-sulfur domain-containing protein n=1 Tax=Dietzia cinnamea TaxID=321318 RepID=A0AAW5Q3A8_9ACTN|nr:MULTISPECIES: CDGSH iron-sulfur domain-containing protein [Dietzia]MCT1638521.1 CDGSH iron-sulfur domain-containing protein [Dietzia cinnamea]MCT1864678.1 CDGSH iron-sulfur domain-containing protein [Dietzia cinnamea]MCT2030711.1 CDGSH iron-sulfur domain-containing protein [Dietzia cinnamea]MCT2033938.1 CDGSH iron-sulfur domain-containing protein [Dietzia cinnamea]MCT2060627.1 CDGSH iron-sulfur domain-containing protein [Dietzia cinnamea]